MPLPTFINLPEEKRQKIIACAIEEFAQQDYNSASISKVVSRAGIAKGSLYQYFTDKSDLYHYLLELAAQKKTELLSNAKPPDPMMNVFDTLHWLFREMAKFQILYPDLAKIGYRAVYGKPPLPEDIVRNATQSTRQYFLDRIEEGKKRGEVRPEIDPGIAAFVLTAALAELTLFLSSQFGSHSADLVTRKEYSNYEAEVEKIYNQIVSILQFGIAKS
jgi:AcrR family transcriptional regulator